jgi:hypothetical protein
LGTIAQGRGEAEEKKRGRQKRRRERKGAKAQGRKGKAEEKRGRQKIRRGEGRIEEGGGRRRRRVKGRDSKATDGLFLMTTSGSEHHPLNFPCRSFLLCVLAPLRLCVPFFSSSVLLFSLRGLAINPGR